MKRMIKWEIKRSFHNPGLWIVLGISLGICLLDILTYHNMLKEAYMGVTYPNIFLEGWLAMDSSLVYNGIFFILLPILAAVPAGASYFKDKKNGYVKNICLKTSKTSYFTAKYIAAAVTGFIAVTVPLLLDMMMAMSFLPVLPPNPLSGQGLLLDTHFMADIYYQYPVVYVLLYTGIDGLFGALFSVISLCITDYMRSSFAVLTVPFSVYLVGDFVLESFHLSILSPHNMVVPVPYKGSSGCAIIGFLIVGFCVTAYMYCVKEKRKDILE